MFTVNGLVSQNSVIVAENTGAGQLTLVGAKLAGGATTAVAMRNTTNGGALLLRDIAVTGYRGVLEQNGTLVPGPKVTAWSSAAPMGGSIEDSAKAWLPIEHATAFKAPPLAQWAILPKPSGADDSEVIQKALNSGKPVVALGAGRWFVNKPLTIPATVRLITGLGAEIDTAKGTWSATAAFLTFIGGKASDQTIVERFCFGGSCPLMIDHLDARTMVIGDMLFFDGLPYRNLSGVKKVFIEDVCGSG